MITEKSLTRVDSDRNGNPRYVVHFSAIADNYADAVVIAKELFSGKKYNKKSYGGGIVFKSYNVSCELDLINQLNYTKGLIDLEGYDLENTAKNSLEVFKKEYLTDYNLKVYGTVREVFFNWCMGLPSAINVEYFYDAIEEKNALLGIVNTSDSMQNHRLYCYAIYNALSALAKAGL